jgi:hypothetical protein
MSYVVSNGEWAKRKAGVVLQRLLPRLHSAEKSPLKWANKLPQQLSPKIVQELSDVRTSK